MEGGGAREGERERDSNCKLSIIKHSGHTNQQGRTEAEGSRARRRGTGLFFSPLTLSILPREVNK